MKHAREGLVLLVAAAIGLASSRGLGQVTKGTIVSELAQEKASLSTVGITALNLMPAGADESQSASIENGQIVIRRVKHITQPPDPAACARVLAEIRGAGGGDPRTGAFSPGAHSRFSEYFVQAELRSTPAATTRMLQIDQQIVVSATVRYHGSPGINPPPVQCSGKLVTK
jgi:hypothetical protein